MNWLMMLAASVMIQAPKPPSIGVFIDFDAAPSDHSVDIMKSEAAKIMKSAGYKLDWRALKDNSGKEAFTDIVVVKFHGKCRVELPSLAPLNPDETVTLASSLVRDGHVLPYTDVRCDEVRKVLADGVPPDRQKAFGIALGRVVAHELYHLLADTTKHASEGLAKASHDWMELVGGVAAFRPSDFGAPAK